MKCISHTSLTLPHPSSQEPVKSLLHKGFCSNLYTLAFTLHSHTGVIVINLVYSMSCSSPFFPFRHISLSLCLMWDQVSVLLPGFEDSENVPDPVGEFLCAVTECSADYFALGSSAQDGSLPATSFFASPVHFAPKPDLFMRTPSCQSTSLHLRY